MAVKHVPTPHGIAHPLEMVDTVLEVADLAWSVYEHRQERERHAKGSRKDEKEEETEEKGEEGDMSKLQAENQRLRAILKENATILQSISKSPTFSKDCPPDLHIRLVSAVDSLSFLNRLEALSQESTDTKKNSFPFEETKEGTDLKTVDILVYDDRGGSSLWVWVNEDASTDKMEEFSGIDSENYVIVCEDQVIDGIASFIAKCILANPNSKNLSPHDLQKTISKALGGKKDWTFWKNVWFAAKLLYALSTWGIVLAGLYRHQAIVKAAARGISASGKLAMKAF